MKLGLALSGGGARGVAHLGAIQALLDRGIKPQIISGVSSGAVVGALYAGGMQPREILELLVKTRIFRYIRPSWSRVGFFNMERLVAIYKLYLPVKTFEELKLSLIISAVDLKEGKSVYFSQGELINPILASTCVPVIFAPLEYNDGILVDGGILNNLPVEPLIAHCDFIIGVHVNPPHKDFKVKSFKNMLERTFHLAVQNNVRERIKYCDLFIEPPQLKNYGLFEISKAEEIYKVGFEHASKVLADAEPLLQKYQVV